MIWVERFDPTDCKFDYMNSRNQVLLIRPAVFDNEIEESEVVNGFDGKYPSLVKFATDEM